jgi:hypothetical protein
MKKKTTKKPAAPATPAKPKTPAAKPLPPLEQLAVNAKLPVKQRVCIALLVGHRSCNCGGPDCGNKD